jgi:hypothetical protein
MGNAAGRVTPKGAEWETAFTAVLPGALENKKFDE